eukprot:SAG11_NODE_170_length_13624_cov_40.078226_1_plen_394_part_00
MHLSTERCASDNNVNINSVLRAIAPQQQKGGRVAATMPLPRINLTNIQTFSKTIVIQDAAPRSVKPQEWSYGTLMMCVEAYLNMLAWALLVAFLEAAYWLYLDPAAKEFTVLGVSAVVLSALTSPIVLEVAPLSRLARLHTVTLSICMVLCFGATLVTDLAEGALVAYVRLGLLWIATSFQLIALGGILSAHAGTPRLARAPWAIVEGLLLLMIIRHGTGSPTVVDATSQGGLGAKVLSIVLGLVATAILAHEARTELGMGQPIEVWSRRQHTAPTSGAERVSPSCPPAATTATARPEADAGTAGAGMTEAEALPLAATAAAASEEGEPQAERSRAWAEGLLVGPQLGVAWTLSLWLLSNPIVGQRLGGAPLEHFHLTTHFHAPECSIRKGER